MADKTQINLERIRACDAEWDESKHKRADNGQFTSGGGATVSKATPAMKGGKFNNPKENIKKIGANALKEINKAGSTKQQFEASWKANEAIKKENDKRIASAATLQKARPKIAAMRQLAKAAGGGKPSLQKLQQAMHNESMMKDRAWLHLDGQDYVKIGRDKWEHHPSNSHALGGTYSSQQMMEKIGKAKKVDLYEPSAPAKPANTSKKNEMISKINSDPKLKAEVMSLKGKPKADANKAAKEKIFKEAAAASKKTAAAKAKKESEQAARTLKKADSEIAKAKAAGDIKSQMFWEAAKNRASKK